MSGKREREDNILSSFSRASLHEAVLSFANLVRNVFKKKKIFIGIVFN